nr:unnamed protein product [Digitaria exilis]
MDRRGKISRERINSGLPLRDPYPNRSQFHQKLPENQLLTHTSKQRGCTKIGTGRAKIHQKRAGFPCTHGQNAKRSTLSEHSRASIRA